jgi:hypothetical protein
MNESLKQVLMRRDGLTDLEADDLIDEVREMMLVAMEEGEDPEEVLMDELGLEPDYLLDIFG